MFFSTVPESNKSKVEKAKSAIFQAKKKVTFYLAWVRENQCSLKEKAAEVMVLHSTSLNKIKTILTSCSISCYFRSNPSQVRFSWTISKPGGGGGGVAYKICPVISSCFDNVALKCFRIPYLYTHVWGGGVCLIKSALLYHFFMFWQYVTWEPEGRYCCTKSMAIMPFWLSTDEYMYSPEVFSYTIFLHTCICLSDITAVNINFFFILSGSMEADVKKHHQVKAGVEKNLDTIRPKPKPLIEEISWTESSC